MDSLTAATHRLYGLNDRLLALYPHPISTTVGDIGDEFAPLNRAIDQIEASVIAVETVHLHLAACSEGRQR